MKQKLHPLRPRAASNAAAICIGDSEEKKVSPVGLVCVARADTTGNSTGLPGGESHHPYTIRLQFVNVWRRQNSSSVTLLH